MASERKLATWIGGTVTVLASALFLFSAAMKLAGGAALEDGMTHMGLPPGMAVPLGILEATCVVIYLVPRTSVLGAVLLTGYLGGAILTHWRVGDLFVIQFALGLFVWLGVYLREPRLADVLPLRRDMAKPEKEIAARAGAHAAN